MKVPVGLALIEGEVWVSMPEKGFLKLSTVVFVQIIGKRTDVCAEQLAEYLVPYPIDATSTSTTSTTQQVVIIKNVSGIAKCSLTKW